METIDAFIGSDAFTIAAYDAPLTASGATQGKRLSQGTTYQSLTEGASNIVRVTLDGTPATATIALADPALPQGSTNTTNVTFDVRDAAGYAIVGAYSDFIEFPCTNNQNYSISISVNGQGSNWIASSTDKVTLTYGGSGIESVTLQACLVLSNSSILGAVKFTPRATFGPETPVGTSLENATSQVDTNSVLFTEPVKARFANLAQGAAQPTYYPLPSGAQPLRMTPPSPTIYFTESSGSLGEWGSNGIIEHALPTKNAGLYGLGGIYWYDDSVWFTEHNVGQVGEMQTISTTYGHVTEYPTGFAKSAPAGMGLGGGGFYFADPGANAIGQVNPGTNGTPVIRKYPLPTASAEPLEITDSDSNGRNWFTEKAASKVASIDVHGKIVEYPSAGIPIKIQLVGSYVFILTATHALEQYDINSGKYTTIAPSSSANGPVVALGFAGYSTLQLMRGNGTTGSLQSYYF